MSRPSPKRPGGPDWVASIDSMIVRVHPHDARLPRHIGVALESDEIRTCPPGHAIGRSRGGLTSKLHMTTDGKGRIPSAVLTAGTTNDTTMRGATLGQIRVPRPGRRRPPPVRTGSSQKGYTSRAACIRLASRGTKATIPEKSDQGANPNREGSFGGWPPFDREAYKGPHVVERGFNRVKNRRGLAVRSEKSGRNSLAAIQLAASASVCPGAGRRQRPAPPPQRCRP
jgi:transposase